VAKVLVVGGAGYVGGTACAWLLDQGHDVWILDDLSTGHELIVRRLAHLVVPSAPRGFMSNAHFRGFTRAQAGDRATIEPLLQKERFDCVMHFAAKSLVAESFAQPELYRENNVTQTQVLLETMLNAGIKRFIFSSTCAIFGNPDPGVERLHEDLPRKPINPYGETKLEVEHMLQTLTARGLQSIALRYFNAAGAEPKGRVGEWHEPETHLIPRLLKSALTGQVAQIYGTDYPTPDGTAIRDYVHVWDLAQAHGAAMARLMSGALAHADGEGTFEAYNLGSENGYSVRQMVTAAARATGRELAIEEKPRRAGDPPRLVGDSTLAKKVLGFKPDPQSLDRIFASAWQWEQTLVALAAASSQSPISPPSRKAVFLDRDGTLNVDPGYLSDPEQLKLFPNIGPALASLKRAGYLLIVVSNQSGIGRGIIQPDALPRIHERMDQLIQAQGGPALDRYEFCIHHPDAGCECRKPKPKLILDVARSLGIDLSRSFMVGDKRVDIQVGRAAGCRASVLVRTGDGETTETQLHRGEANFIAPTLADAARWILAQENAVP
jgi:UDP-glucose 4-epimerase